MKHKTTLVKITVLAALPVSRSTLDLHALAEHLAEILRTHDGAVVTRCEADAVEAAPDAATEAPALRDALTTQFPTLGLPMGPLPSVRMLGRDGEVFAGARLEQTGGQLDLYLGFDGERFPLLTFRPHTGKRI